MGNSPSKQSDPMAEKRLSERLHALEIEEENAGLGKGYVHVTDEKCMPV